MTTDDCQAEKKGGVREGRIEKNSKKKKGLKKRKKERERRRMDEVEAKS